MATNVNLPPAEGVQEGNWENDLELLNDESKTPASDKKAEKGDLEEEFKEPDEKDLGEDKEPKEDDKEPEEAKAEKDQISGLTRTKLSEVTKEYPEFFKKFPDLRHAFFREREFTKIFSSVEDAKETAERAYNYDEVEKSFLDGDIGTLVNKIEDKNQAINTVRNILPSLQKTNPQLYIEAISPSIQQFIYSFYKEGERESSEDKMNAAMHLALWAFGDTQYATGEKKIVEPTKSKAQDEFEKEKQDFYKQKYITLKDEVGKSVDRRVRKEIMANFDPENVFTDTVRDLLVAKIIDEVDATIGSDPAHMRRMNQLWKQAERAGFTDEWKSKITNAYLMRALPVLPEVKSKISGEAIKSSASPEKKKEAEVKSGRIPESNSGDKNTPRRVDYRKTSDLDILNGKIAYRK
jgi:hypothetical protein